MTHKLLGALSAFLAMATGALLATDFTWTGGGTPNADGSYNWQDAANWNKSDGSFPGVNKDGDDTTNDKAIFPQNAAVAVRMDRAYTVGTIDTTKTGLDLTIYGCGTNRLITATNVGQGSKVTFDNIGLTGYQMTYNTGCSLRLQNGAHYLITWFAMFKGSNSLEIVNNSAFVSERGINLDYAGDTLLVDSNSTISAVMAISAYGTAGNPTSWQISNGSAFYTGAKCTFTCGGEIKVTGKSTFQTVADFTFDNGTTLTIDDSSVSSSGKISFGFNDSRIVFKGDNPVLRSTSGLTGKDANPQPAYACKINFDFEVPVAGYLEAPIQLNTTSANQFMYDCRFTSRAWLKNAAHFNILPTSPAALSDKKTIAQLTSSNKGTARYSIGFPEGGTVSPDAFAFLQGDATTPASTDANAIGLWVTIGDGEIAVRAITESKGVAAGISAAVAHRTVTASTSVSQMANATGYSTRLRFYAGSENSASGMTLVSTQPIAANGSYSAEWTADRIGSVYFCRFVLETLDGNGNVVFAEDSPIATFTTVDDTIYTWKAKNGNWDGNWSDPDHWDDNANGDCYGYPSTADAGAVFPAGAVATVTLDRTRSIRSLDMSANDIDLTFVNASGTSSDNALSVVGGINVGGFNANGTGGQIVLDGVTVNATSWSPLGKARRTVALVNGTVFKTTYGTRVQGSNVWLKVSGKSSFTTDNLFISGGGLYDGGIELNDSSLVSDGIILGADNAAGKPCVIRFSGENPTWKPRGNLTVANGNPLRLEFAVPLGDYAEPPIQVSKAAVAFTANTEGSTTAKVPLLVTGDSPVREGLSRACPLVTSAGGFALDNVVLELHKRTSSDRLIVSERAADWTRTDWLDAESFSGAEASLRALGVKIAARSGLILMIQ